MPIDELKEIYENYLESSNSVNKNKDEFFDTILGMKGNAEDGMFNMLNNQNKTVSKAAFFAEFGVESKKEKITKKNPVEEY